MPTVKMTEIIEVVDRNITDLKAGDPSWTPEQMRKAKDAIQMMQAFKVLTAESCGDTVQGMPTWPGHRGHGVTVRKPVRRSVSH